LREEDIVDPRVVPRWVETGVSGVPRGREWDAVAVVDVPELEGSPASEIAFVRLPDGALEALDEGVAQPELARLAAGLEESLDPPYEARAARRGTREWSVAARRIDLARIDLPAGLEASEITLAVGLDGSRTLLADGEEPRPTTPALEQAAAELERRGQARAASFVARAERLGSATWVLTVDPL
jgi:hypothetical protein